MDIVLNDRSAIWLWNTACIVDDKLTPLGVIAMSCEVEVNSDCTKSFFETQPIAAFLRRWADTIDPVKTATV